MSITFWGASVGHFSKNFDLTSSQRTLMLQTILFLMYLLIGALVFSHTEGWKYLDAVYWADVTLFTVGFGDFATSTTLGRALLFPYALIGVISLGLVIGSIRSMILDRAQRRVGVRMQEMTRRKVVRTLTKRGTDEVLNPIGEDSVSGSNSPPDDKTPQSEYDRRRAEFELMRKVQHRAVVRRRWMSMAISTGTWLVLWLVGAFVFLKTEEHYQSGWTYFDSFYLCFVSLTTIGYGDRTPVSNAGKSFWVFWSLLALPTMTVLISNAGDTVVKVVRDATDRVGSVTILPNSKECPEDGKDTADTNTNQEDHVEKAAQELRKNRHKRTHDDSKAVGHHLRHAATYTSGIQFPHRHHPLRQVPTGRHFHILLVAEIQHITEHIREGKSKHYSFEEWAWYLSLLGEDERNPHTHRRARGHEKRHKTIENGEASSKPGNEEEEGHKWSWIGNRSPISSGQDESDWILDRLTCKLKESLLEGMGHGL